MLTKKSLREAIVASEARSATWSNAAAHVPADAQRNGQSVREMFETYARLAADEANDYRAELEARS